MKVFAGESLTTHYRLLLSFIQRTNRAVGPWKNFGEKDMRRMFAFRNRRDHQAMLRAVALTIQAIGELLRNVQAAEPKLRRVAG